MPSLSKSPAASPMTDLTFTQAIVSIARRQRRSLLSNKKGLLLPIALLVLWEAASRLEIFPPILPAPSVVVGTIAQLTSSGALMIHITATLGRVAIGFFLGALVATLLGAATGYSGLVRQLLDPLLQALRNIPSLAWVPLFIVWLGIGETSKVALIAIGVFFPVYLNLMTGIQTVDRKLVEVGQMYRFDRLKLIRRIFLPAALPVYLVGLRSGLGLSWIFVIGAEFTGASSGLGVLLIDGQTTNRPAVILASILLLATFGKLTDAVLEALSAHLLEWQASNAQP